MVVSAKQSLKSLQQELRESAEARAAFDRFAQLDAVIREVADTQSVGAISQASGSSVSISKPATTYYVRTSLAIAAGIIIALTATLYYQRVNAGPQHRPDYWAERNVDLDRRRWSDCSRCWLTANADTLVERIEQGCRAARRNH